MVCIYCSRETKVTNSRHQKRANRIWRRRKCVRCGNVVTTLEALDYATSISFRNTQGRPEPFLRDKLFMSLYTSLQHRKTALSDATELTDTLLIKLATLLENGMIERAVLIPIAAEILDHFDTAAAVHYRAFHQD